MIRLLRNQNIRDANPLIESMFEDRKRIFFDLLNWDIPVVDGRFEIDEFDNEHAIYLVATDADGAHAGSLRLLPTIRPHLLGSHFSDLCPLGVPTGPDIFEITRLCLPQRLGAAMRLEIRNKLISAMIDHAVTATMTRLTGVVEAAFRKQIIAMGWRAEPLGPACRHLGGNLGAFAIDVEPCTSDRLRWTSIYRPNQLVTPIVGDDA